MRAPSRSSFLPLVSTRGRSRHVLLATGLLAVLATVSAPAAAKPDIPGKLQEMLKAKSGKDVCTPSCMLCHTDPAGGDDRIREPKLSVLLVYSLADNKNVAGLDGLDKTNTDDDDVTDYQELVAGTDPYAKGTSPICAPVYGCGARIAPASSSNRATSGAAALFAAAVATYLVRRPRRQR